MSTRSPNTRAVLLEGLRQALQARVVQLYSNLTLAGETDTRIRGERGLERAIDAYERAWHYICDITEEEEEKEPER